MSNAIPERSGDPPTKFSMISLLPNLLTIILVLAAILFISAGRLDWLQAWVFVLGLAGFYTFYGLWGVQKDQGQLKERSQIGQNTKS